MVYRVFLLATLLIINLFASNDLKIIENFEANFVQSVTNTENKTIKYYGKIIVKNTKKVLWKYEKPIIKNVYVLGNTVIIDEPELEQAIYTSLDKSISIEKLINNSKKVSSNKYKSTINEKEYFFTIKDSVIKSLEFKDQLDNKVSIIFNNVKNKQNISDDIFNFFPPNYYDIIKK